jgi:hypothetical protein
LSNDLKKINIEVNDVIKGKAESSNELICENYEIYLDKAVIKNENPNTSDEKSKIFIVLIICSFIIMIMKYCKNHKFKE